MPDPLFIGIDGGASKCRARITGADGNILGESERRGSANIASRKPDRVMHVIIAAIRAAARGRKIPEADWRKASVGLGLAGADVKSKRDELISLFRAQNYFRKVDIRTDAYVTWLGAFGGKDGAILILGTGSCGLAVVDGVQRYVAGYGPQVSDEASGHWLGRNALRRALWAYDGRIETTELARSLLARFHNDPVEIIEFANSKEATPAKYAELAPLIFDYAGGGDALAVALASEAAADGERIIARLLDHGASSVYLHGGISERLAQYLRPAVRKYLKRPLNVEGVPLEGATLLARRISHAGRTGRG